MTEAKQATKADLKENKRRCWSPPCNKSAWFEDWGGWHWCWKHTWREILQNETIQSKWFEIKTLKIRWPF